MTTDTVVVLGPRSDEQRARIESAAGRYPVRFATSLEPADPGLADVVAVGGSVRGDVLAAAPRLRWVHSWAAGPDADLSPEMRAAGHVVLTSSAGNGAIPLAEQAMLLMMMLDRDVPRWMRAQADHRWDRFTHGELAGATLGIVGVGNAGTDLARKARAFHMRVLGCRRNPGRPVDGVERMYGLAQLHEFLGECDVVVVTAPATPETRGVFDEEAFRAMRPTATWICISRGGIADDDALLRALREGWIAGAGIDAHGVEPLPAGSPFWTAPNTVVTPHNGATTAGTARRGLEIFLDNLTRFAAGDELVNVVDKAAGY
ncbi:D-2-hydroxyacid dehydrogenase [Pseudonocardia nematodicida]|uniref:D-2-hydroxyacid dehydrogenase n=1 Tax=Pseudonocardia nematodicida TaxID=1206997 RepID=A0ABV1KFI7_9PSEU